MISIVSLANFLYLQKTKKQKQLRFTDFPFFYFLFSLNATIPTMREMAYLNFAIFIAKYK